MNINLKFIIIRVQFRKLKRICKPEMAGVKDELNSQSSTE